MIMHRSGAEDSVINVESVFTTYEKVEAIPLVVIKKESEQGEL